ncbi:MAG: DUF885 family protein [Caulobacteraceae bacterium]|nr:MAG: DUF885 family protein [Caulobacteraceae bacterium]
MWKALAAALILILPPAGAWAQAPDAKARLDAIVADYQAWSDRENPIGAGFNGDREALSKLPDVTLAADQRRAKELKVFEDRLKQIPEAGLSENDALNRAILIRVIDDEIQSIKFDQSRFAFSSDDTWDGTLSWLADSAPMASKADAEAYLKRLAGVPKIWADSTDNARRGIRTGWVQPRYIAERVLGEAKANAAKPVADTDPLVRVFDKLPASVTPAEKAAFKARGLALVKDQIVPARRTFVTFLEKEYLPATKAEIGVGRLKGGKEYYAWLARRYTTTNMTPEEIHALGVSEVARIRAEMDTVMAETGFKGTFPEFLAFLRSDKRFVAESRQDLLEKASEIAKRIDDRLPAFFATLPRLPYGVREVPREIEDNYTTGRYFPGSPQLGVAGGYMVNTGKLDQRGLYELPALTLHEAVPGHHLQIALSQELPEVPAFRRDADMTAYVEGWGLYSERLGIEMGIYRDPYEQFGRLSYEMWRACRLVADTGMHYLGWDLEKARACFTDNSALSAHNIDAELARYVSWPGQALAYKIGERTLVKVRAKAEKELGDRFDVRRFHDAVLLAGPLPMDLLEQRIDRWIVSEKARK